MVATTEAVAEQMFRKYKKQFIKKMGSGSTTDAQLDEQGKRLFGKQYIGAYPQDQAPLGRTGRYAIVNTDVTNGPGVHWVAMYLTPKTVYAFDSFARPSASLLKTLTKNAKGKKIKIIDSDKSDQEQFGSTSICGQLCLAWLCTVQKLGVRAAIKI